MNHKEFIADLSDRTGYSSKEANALVAATVSSIISELSNENSIVIGGFGTFEVKKKLERVLVNPTTKQRMLVPPKMAVSFKPTATLKDRLKNK